ncbi:Calcium/calmodulin-dependent protein kinase type II subunit beta [Sorochytrium milnesiophthora]
MEEGADLSISWEMRLHHHIWAHEAYASAARYLAPPIAIEMRSMCGILVTPLMPGTLRDLMSSALYLPSAFVLNMWQQLNQAVAGLHRMGVIHCDIKPDNVLLAPDCTPILNDFGLSTLGVQQGSRGTPAYESPLVSQQDYVNAKDDVWACGLTIPGRRFDYDSAEFATGLQQLAVGGECCLVNSITDFRLRAPLTAFFDLWRMAAATRLPFMWCEFAKILQDQLGGEAASVPVYRAMISKTLLQPVLQQYYAPVDHGATFQNLLDAVNLVPAPQPSCADPHPALLVSPVEDDSVLAEKTPSKSRGTALKRRLQTPPLLDPTGNHITTATEQGGSTESLTTPTYSATIKIRDRIVVLE